MVVTWTEKFNSFVPAAIGWQDYDIFTNLGVPKGAVAHILMQNGNTATDVTLGVRTNGSLLARYIPIHESEAPASSYNGILMDVTVDAGTGLIETYCSTTTSVIFFLLGYFTGVTFTERIDLITSLPAATWNTIDLSGYGVGAGDVCQFALCNRAPAWYCDMGVRAVGSALSRLIRVHEAECGTNYAYTDGYTNYVKADASGDAQVYIQYAWVDAEANVQYARLLGYYDADTLDYQERWTAKDILNNSSWDPFDLTADLDQDGRVVNVCIFNTGTGAGNTLGVRGGDSAVNRYYLEHEAEGYGITGACFPAQSDATGVIDLYASVSGSENTYLGGYFIFEEEEVAAVERPRRYIDARRRVGYRDRHKTSRIVRTILQRGS